MTTKKYKVAKNWLGSLTVRYLCPHCGEGLRSPIGDAGKEDYCPDCRNRFIVPGSDELERVSAAQEEAAERAVLEKAERLEAKRLQRIQREAERTQASEEAEARRAQQDRLNEEKREEQAQAAAAAAAAAASKQKTDANEPAKRRLPWLSGGVAASVVSLLIIYVAVRGSDLRAKLDQCESKGVVTAHVSYSGFFSTDTVVFDLRGGSSASARRIDPVHLLMQFADKLNLDSVNRIVLARNGQERFYITGSDLRTLADSYGGGGRIWAFNNLPASVRRMDETRAYAEWSGGWLGVLNKQAEDLDEFIEEWIGYDSVGVY